MKIAVVLHFYQPYNQQDDILLRIVNECYLPLTRGLLANKSAKVIVNMNGVLTQLLVEKGYTEIIDNLKALYKNGQLEFTGSAMYHAFLPLLQDEEVTRQIKANFEVNQKYFGDCYKPEGFFSPEMAVSESVINLASENGYKWIFSPQLSYPLGNPPFDRLYKDKNSDINIFFREKRISSLMLSGVCRNSDDFITQTQDLFDTDKYWVAVMDAETFGHHRIGHEKFLFDVLNNEKLEPVLIKDLMTAKNGFETEYVSLRPSTWTNEEQDFWLDKEHKISTTDKSFILWKDPENPIHKLQWELTDFVISLVQNCEDKNKEEYIKAREQLDKAVSSDQYWWASAKPWWSLEMIEQGAYELKNVANILEGNLGSNVESVKKAEELYRKILDQAFEWQRSGYIRKKHLENSSTFMKEPFKKRTHAEWFNQLMLEFEDEMKKSAEIRDYEKAIKWRDALIKINQGTDIYDVLHVVDELWSARTIPSLKPFFEYEWAEFSEFSKQNFIYADDEEKFNKWKKERKRVEGRDIL